MDLENPWAAKHNVLGFDGVALVRLSMGSMSVPCFSTEHLAAVFISEHPEMAHEFTATPLENFHVIREFLEAAKRLGAEYMSVDPFNSGQPDSHYSIDILLADLPNQTSR